MNCFRIAQRLLMASLFCLTVSGLGSAAHAQATPPEEPEYDIETALPQDYTLVNLDTPLIAAARRGTYNIDVRAAGAAENSTYLSFEGQYSLRRDFALIARVTGSYKRYYGQSARPFIYGGRESELAAKLGLGRRGPYRMAIQASVLNPDQGSRRTPYFAAQLLVSRNFGKKTTLYFVPKVLLPNRALVTLGGGAKYRFNDQFTVFGDIQGAITGDNSTSVFSGLPIQKEVWGVGLRYTPSLYRGHASLDLGITNGLGRTTGFSTTAALSGSAAFYVNLTYRN